MLIKSQIVPDKNRPGRMGPPSAPIAGQVKTDSEALPLSLEHFYCLLVREGTALVNRVNTGEKPAGEATGRRKLVVVGGAGVGERGEGMEMQAALEVRTEFLDQVADQDFAHLFMAELNSLYQRTVQMVRVPVSGDHA